VGGIGNVIVNTVVRSPTKYALGKATKSAGSLVGKKVKRNGGGNKRKGAAKGKGRPKRHK
jgi:hypothetical protein